MSAIFCEEVSINIFRQWHCLLNLIVSKFRPFEQLFSLRNQNILFFAVLHLLTEKVMHDLTITIQGCLGDFKKHEFCYRDSDPGTTIIMQTIGPNE